MRENTIVRVLAFALVTNMAMAQSDRVFQEISEVQQQREALYNNGHFVWKERSAINGEVSETIQEYWARDGIYFRLDSQSADPDSNELSMHRYIVRPEGYAKLRVKSVDQSGSEENNGRANDGVSDGVIVSFGPAEQGKMRTQGQYFVALANKLATVPVYRWWQWWNDGSKNDLKSIDLKEQADGTLLFTMVRDTEPGLRTSTATLTPNDYRVTQWTYSFRTHDGEQTAEQKAEVTYDPTHLDIPLATKDKAVSNWGERSEMECRLVSYDLEPAPLDVFGVSLPGVAQTNPWNRRFVLLGVGLALLAFYFVAKRVRRRRT